jgi:glycosyltransferase 2 family protein
VTATLERDPQATTRAPGAPRGRGPARLRLAGGAAILAVLVWRLGTGPIVSGLRTISVGSLVAATAITAVTTAASAWRWTLVARGLGVAVRWPTAFAAYYRSQFLNTALPGGVLGDVHRGVRHGRDAGDVGRGLRAVAWERGAGQVVQSVLAVVVLLALASPVRSAMPVVLAVVAGGVLVSILAARALPRLGQSRRARVLRAIRDDLRHGVLARPTWPGITLASVIVVAGHAAVFLISARTAGASASVLQLLPLAMLVLLAMSVPANIGGWGPREGAAAWLFAAAGLGAGQGVATATVYGVLVFAAGLPGAVVLVAAWVRRRPSLVRAREADDG